MLELPLPGGSPPPHIELALGNTDALSARIAPPPGANDSMSPDIELMSPGERVIVPRQ